MSYWCAECNRLNYNDDKCDFCGHTKKNNSKTWKVPEPKKVRIMNGNKNNKKSYMIPCDICGNDIAVKATSCPHCGDTKSKNLFWKIIKIIAIVLTVLFILQIIFTSIGIAILDNEMDKTLNQFDKTGKELRKMANDLKPPVIKQIENIKIPQFKISESQYQKEEREREKKEAIRKQRVISNIKRKEERAKDELKRQMSL